MTISEQTPKNEYVGDSVNDTFAYTFTILEDDDLVVEVDNVLQVLSIDYTLQNQVENGGDVVFEAGSIPGDGLIISLVRDTDIDQDLVYTPFDPFPAKSHEGALDKITMLLQELDSLVTSGAAGFDPTLDQIISGNWQFTKLLKALLGVQLGEGSANGLFARNIDDDDNLPLAYSQADSAQFGSNNFETFIRAAISTGLIVGNQQVARVISKEQGGLQIQPRNSTLFTKVGFRNPTFRNASVNTTVSQDDEGQIIRMLGAGGNTITCPILEVGTCVTILLRTDLAAADNSVIEDSGITLVLMDGDVNPSGSITLKKGAVLQLYWETNTIVLAWGTSA